MAYLSKDKIYEIKKANDLESMKYHCDMDKTNYLIHLEYARMLIHNGMYTEAKEELKSLLGTKYDTAARYEYGRIAFFQKNYDLARDHFEHVNKNTCYNLERDKAIFMLGKLEFECKNFETSETYFNDLLGTSFDESSRFYLGRIWLTQGKYEEAKKAFKELLDSKYSEIVKYEPAKTE